VKRWWIHDVEAAEAYEARLHEVPDPPERPSPEELHEDQLAYERELRRQMRIAAAE
jgi:hypothetical protein